jgi:hypothetical protein
MIELNYSAVTSYLVPLIKFWIPYGISVYKCKKFKLQFIPETDRLNLATTAKNNRYTVLNNAYYNN